MFNGDSNDVCTVSTVSTVQYEYFVRLFVCLHKSDMIVGRRERGRRCGEKPPPQRFVNLVDMEWERTAKASTVSSSNGYVKGGRTSVCWSFLILAPTCGRPVPRYGGSGRPVVARVKKVL